MTSPSAPAPSLEDYCGRLVTSILPAAKKRRGETSEGRSERKAYQTQMEDKMADLAESIKANPLRTPAQINEATKAKLSRYGRDGGQETMTKYEEHLSQLGDLPIPQAGELANPVTSTLDVLERLAFTGAAPSSSSQPTGNGNGIPSRVTSTTSNASTIPASTQSRTKAAMDPPSNTNPASKNRNISSASSATSNQPRTTSAAVHPRISSSASTTSTSTVNTLRGQNQSSASSQRSRTTTPSQLTPTQNNLNITSNTNGNGEGNSRPQVSQPQPQASTQTNKPSSTSSSTAKPSSSSKLSSSAKSKPSSTISKPARPTIKFLASSIQTTNSNGSIQKLPRSALLQEWRSKMAKPTIAEPLLLKDMIFLFQGINGTYVGFEEVRELPREKEFGVGGDGDEVDDEPEVTLKLKFMTNRENGKDGNREISSPTKDLIHRLVELGRLYRRIKEFQESTSGGEGEGLVMQSLKHFISKELSDYYRLIAILEDSLNGSLSSAESTFSTSTSRLTLKRILIFTEKVSLRFRLISTLIESCKNSKGGSLISLIHSYTFNGDPFIRSFTSNLLEEVSRPFLDIMNRWIYEGELIDPYEEFFVQANSNVLTSQDDDEDENSGKIWNKKFSFKKEMLPSFLKETLAKKIFSTGKSLNFIRYSCDDSEWIATRNHLGGSTNKELRYADIVGLEQTIESAFTIASKRLLDIFLDKFKLLGHLRALRDYLMLTRGDFVEVLMESIGPSLSRPSSTLFRHNLSASLETAVRGSNSQFEDPDILRRLDAKILESNPGDVGWDTFSLDYHVDSPVNTVLDSDCMENYKVVFNHLWRIKRVELSLGKSWRRIEKSGMVLGRVKEGDDVTKVLQKQCRKTMLLLSEMIHFVRQMQGYCQLEVLDYSWHDLQGFFEKRQGDLDELIETHRIYLDSLIGKMLLRGGGKKGSGMDSLAEEVRSNLDSMLSFSKACDDLSHMVNADTLRYNLVTKSKSKATSSSRPNTPTFLNKIADPKEILKLSTRMEEVSDAFKARTEGLIYILGRHPNLVVRDLGVRLNFNAIYSRDKKDNENDQNVEVK